jgi:Ca-activated chloride channel family protein
MINFINNFHFIRPWWLLALLPAFVLWWQMLKQGDPHREWKKWVDPALLDALLVQGIEKRRIRPVHVLGIFLLLAIVAVAGPTWQREPSPFAEDEAALVIVLKVADSMEEDDIAPSRLKRATQKISDLLAARPGAGNGLIAYAGSAHLVMPLTKDAAVINVFAADLTPDLMPSQGDNAVDALKLAEKQLAKSHQPGAVLFITDELGEDAIAAIADYRKKGGVPVHVWAATTDISSALEQAAKAGGGTFTSVSPDASDVERLVRNIQQTATSAVSGEGERWQDKGYWFLPFLMIIGISWFRRGWVVFQW